MSVVWGGEKKKNAVKKLWIYLSVAGSTHGGGGFFVKRFSHVIDLV